MSSLTLVQLLQPALNNSGYKIAPAKKKTISWIMNASAVHCPIALKFHSLGHYGSAQAAISWLEYTFFQIQNGGWRIKLEMVELLWYNTSRPLPLSLSCFEVRQLIGNIKQLLRALLIDLCPLIWSVYSISHENWSYKISPLPFYCEKGDREYLLSHQ